jgi:two-component system NtrC family response regulator
MMKEDKFRQDLFYRLNVIRIHVPPLRERKEDIPPLVDYFIRQYNKREGGEIEGISAEAMNLLMQHSFPGNIRELESAIERAGVFCEGSDITTADLPLDVKEARKEDIISDENLSLNEKVGHIEIQEIKKALNKTSGVKSKAARVLGITERILSYKMKHYGIPS